MPVRILHPRQQLHQHHRRIRSPVPIMPAMQRAVRPIDRNLHMRISPRAKGQDLPPRLIHRPIAHQPDIPADQLLMRIQNRLQVRRPSLFLALPHKPEIRLQGHMRFLQSRQRHQLREDRGLIVPCPTRIHPLLPIHGLHIRSKRRTIAPFGRSHRLPVIVRIEHDRPRRPRRPDLAIHHRRHIRRQPRSRQQLRLRPSRAQSSQQKLRIVLQPSRIQRNIRDRKKLLILLQQLRLPGIRIRPRRSRSRRNLSHRNLSHRNLSHQGQTNTRRRQQAKRNPERGHAQEPITPRAPRRPQAPPCPIHRSPHRDEWDVNPQTNPPPPG